MKIAQAYDYIFPVFSVKKEGGFYMLTQYEVFGTSFYIGNNLFVTAGHTIESSNQGDGKSGLAYIAKGTNHWKGLEIDNYEIFDKFDIAIAHVKDMQECKPEIMKWGRQLLAMNSPITTLGFPFGTTTKNSIRTRSFSGRIVSIGDGELIHKPDVQILELSFQVPRGLSGAPIKFEFDEAVYGVVIANFETGMDVLTSAEILEDGKTKSTYTRREFLNLGVAVPLTSFQGEPSKLLGMTFLEYLEKEGMLVDTKIDDL